MKKLSKRFLTLAITCVMAMMMAVPAFADWTIEVPFLCIYLFATRRDSAMGNDYNDCVLTYGKLTLAYQTGTYDVPYNVFT